MRIFSDNGYISIDFLDKNAESFEIMDPMNVPDIEGLLFTPNDGLDKNLLLNRTKNWITTPFFKN